jgi:ribosomal protein S18 acetylase RimI-like enzyme
MPAPSVHLRLEEAAPAEYEALLPLLSEADESDDRIRTEMTAPSRVSYRATVDGQLVGAAVMRWQPDESELVYIAVRTELRGQGHGKAIVAALLDEADRRAVASVVVGTANSSLDNIGFYQRCGFRMDEVRRDHFAYVDPPVVERGIVMRDMLVLRYRPEASRTRQTPPNPGS